MSRSSPGTLLAASSLACVLLFPFPSVADEESKTESWRLFIADHSLPVVHVVDLKSGKEISRFDIDGYAALSLSQSGRTVFAVQGEKNVVHALDTGISLSDHGEHRDIEISDPKLLATVMRGEKPGHVVTHGDDVAIFYDRGGKFDLLSEADLTKGKADIRAFGTTAAHHGVAVPMGNHLLVSVPNMAGPVKDDELPPRLGLRVLDRKGEQVGRVETCTGLHGEATSARLVAFGCEEGVLVVRPGGIDGPKIEMLAYGSEMPKGKVSTLLGGTSMQFFLGNYGERNIVLIDPDNKAEPYKLIELPTRRIDFVLDAADPRHAYVLTEDGNLHRIDVVEGGITKSGNVTEPYSKDGHWRDPRPRLTMAGNLIAITDPRHSLVRLVDGETLKEIRSIPVEGQPFAIVAAGGSGAVH
ncbi:zinc metallochaperone AztD [Rhizobium rhizogenes]|uniref:zinc metallochaperone AztD n=1 Tax=Rhizobium rhizogenes TaxID=359 RepID=UPI0022718816|nr:zinc metallochaperone AztD [Rhizobium rhizogenes]